MNPTDTLAHPESDERDFVAGTNEYAQLGQQPEAQAARARLSVADYNDRAADVVRGLGYQRKKLGSATEAYKAVAAEYMTETEETDPQLRSLAHVMLLAPAVMGIGARIEAIDDRWKGRMMSAEDARQRHDLVRAGCEFNNELGSIIETQLDTAAAPDQRLTPGDVLNWLDAATGDRDWAVGIVQGIQGELAGGELLHEAGLVGVRHGSVDEDMAGKDYLFSPTSMGYSSIDVKTGKDRPPLPVTTDHSMGKVILSINPQHIAGFSIKEQYREGYLNELRGRVV